MGIGGIGRISLAKSHNIGFGNALKNDVEADPHFHTAFYLTTVDIKCYSNL